MCVSRWLILACLVMALPGATAVFHVSPDGDDRLDGTSPTTAFASIQRGVDALKPGDTLLIGPGEYRESVRRQGLGSDETVTVIRAKEPGTVVLRGDVPAPSFRRVHGYRYIYVTDFPGETTIHTINERDTLEVLQAQANLPQLDFTPGSFWHDRRAGLLYLSSSDLAPVPEHQYSFSIGDGHGLYLEEATRVTVEGLVVTGFNGSAMRDRREGTMGAVYGIFLQNCRQVTVRDSDASFNGCGIGMHSGGDEDGRNVIECCRAWANATAFCWGDPGGITVHGQGRGNWELVRDCIAFANRTYGINMYSGARPRGIDEARRNLFIDCLAWDSGIADFKIKTGTDSSHRMIRCVGPGLWSVQNIDQSLVGKQNKEVGADSIHLATVEDLDPLAEFADPLNLDYRLQATSRFRGAAPTSGDLGPFPYQETVFYVRPDGDDAAAGTSVAQAWQTLGRALRERQAGDTLYLIGGAYALPDRLELPPVTIAGRGDDKVVLTGETEILGEAPVWKRVQFRDQSLLVSRDHADLARRHERTRRLAGPFVHSVTATTANLQWWVSVSAEYEIAWGETLLLENREDRDSSMSGSFSLTGLKPGRDYYFRVSSQTPMERVGSDDWINGVTIRFRTTKEAASPRDLYVAPDGDDGATGTSRESAWRTVQQAAHQVRPGDTVWLAGGTYAESVHLRVTGAPGRPITFRALPGQKVVLDGLERQLTYAFMGHNLDHLRFDALYFRGFQHISPYVPYAYRIRGNNGAISLYHCDDIQVTRCFLDGRGQGYSPGLLQAVHCADVVVRNCAMTNAMGNGLAITGDTPCLRVEHCVYLRNLISQSHLHPYRWLPKEDRGLFAYNIVTDAIPTKVFARLFHHDATVREHTNCIYSRISPDERSWSEFTEYTLAEYLADLPEQEPQDRSLVANPDFAGFAQLDLPPGPLPPMADVDALIKKENLDFPDLFTLNPELIERCIGLEPDAFADFHFYQKDRP